MADLVGISNARTVLSNYEKLSHFIVFILTFNAGNLIRHHGVIFHDALSGVINI